MTVLLWLTITLPLLGIILQTALPRPQVSRWLALLASVASALIALVVVMGMYFGWTTSPFLFSFDWIPTYGVNYVFRLDGLNGPAVFATSLIFPLTLVAEWTQGRGRQGLHALLLLMQTATLGALLADDLFLQFFFYSMTLVPIFFMVSIWGQSEQAEKVGARVVATTSLAHALIFFGILLLYYSVDPHTYLISTLAESKLAEKTVALFGIDWPVQKVAFAFITLGFAIRVPIWPLHGWMSSVVKSTPSAFLAPIFAVGAPTGMILYSRLLYQLFPEILVEYQSVFMGVGLVCLLFPVLTLISQDDHRSVGQKWVLAATGFSIIALACIHSASLTGLVILLFSTCLAVGGYFGVVQLLFARTHTYEIPQQGGILHQFPFLAVCFAIFVGSLAAVPGSVGFVGGALLQLGDFKYHWGVAFAALVAFLFAAGFSVRSFQKVFLGPKKTYAEATHLSVREISFLLPLLIAVLFFGLYPSPLLSPAKDISTALLERLKDTP